MNRAFATLLGCIAFGAAACDSVAPLTPRPAEEAELKPGVDLASVAMAVLKPDRSKFFHIVIPDATRSDKEATVLYIRGNVTEAYRFIHAEKGWALESFIGSETDTPAFDTPDGLSLNRGSPISSYPPPGTPALATIVYSGSIIDGTLYPIRYDGGSYATYRWTQSAEVVSGFADGVRTPASSSFASASAIRWRTADSVFTVDAYRKWTFGDMSGTLRECTTPATSPTTPCSAPTFNYPGSSWADAHYHITVATRLATSITVSPTSISLSPGGTQQMGVVVKDQHGDPMPAPVTWTTSNSAVATVSSSGMVTIQGLGSATITATSGALSASATVTGVVSITLSGPTSAVNATATVTSTVNPAGTYWYSWSYARCDFRTGERDCTTVMNEPLPSGFNVTSASVYISRYDDFVRFKLYLRNYEGGPVIGYEDMKVYGGGEVFGTGSNCGGLKICP